MMAFLVSVFAVLNSPDARAQAQCYDSEKWSVDRQAIEQVFSNVGAYLARPEPILINLKTLGASSGQLVVVFIKKDLQCSKQQYESNKSSFGSGPQIEICKRPKCS
jgi:hypothetical protein